MLGYSAASKHIHASKNTGEDKKLKHHIESKYDSDDLANSNNNGSGNGNGNGGAGGNSASLNPPDMLCSPLLSPVSPFGPLAQPTSRKTLFYLLATLNAAYPDYDFSDIKPEFFTKVPVVELTINSVNNMLLVHLGDKKSAETIGTSIWAAIEETAEMKDCDIYSFNPDRELEPDAEEGNLWSFYFFFFNKRLKRMVFFTCRSVSLMAPMQPEEEASGYLRSDSDGDILISDDVSVSKRSPSLSYEEYTMQPFQLDM
eukprot:jgi/Hompol1/4786/HPOL_003881-RA